jgi:hypothetical protein
VIALSPPRRRRGSRRRLQPTPLNNKLMQPKAEARPRFVYRTRIAVYRAVHDGQRWRIERFEA